MFSERHHDWLRGFRRPLFGYACALTTDTASAEDLYHDALVRAMAARSVPVEQISFRVWMFRILRNLWIDGLRARQRQDALLDEETGVDCDARGLTGGEERVVNQLAVRQAFMLLSKPHRDVLALVDIAGFSYDEAATLLNVPRGTVMSRVSRARSALACRLAEGPVVALPLRRGRAQ
ncbi:MAG: RNA polymerase sigma-70 factor, ECF subfamily [Rhodobacteraceae bacterium HLUCCA12]|nr:MAG: RNA polymerase sigma-70 factor, ECF subfamily [Rhodobacteraceae bacterium HLUCCA12]